MSKFAALVAVGTMAYGSITGVVAPHHQTAPAHHNATHRVVQCAETDGSWEKGHKAQAFPCHSEEGFTLYRTHKACKVAEFPHDRAEVVRFVEDGTHKSQNVCEILVA